ncbi:TolC family outer membrane protein [Terrihabitans rhizophilus]|uniref:TolC family outer membrane protein n=1 Tax=Terrihabitans rhizophilus TaxID=3092662 RepID=A0ABU4RQ97_9HYPH|nr:TolC family outer membrane protein [Terrihabitans sp. PJ23]MDX6807020.1 TolC family outer membrane protein [Terrihabitans sp. PJ23]
MNLKARGLKRLLSLLVAQTALVAVFAAPVSAETLMDALAQAYTANPTLNAQRAATRATDESVPQALSGYRPQISGSLDGGRTAGRTWRPGGARVDSDAWTASTGVTIQQNIFNGYRTRNGVRQAESGVLSARETLLNTEQNVLYDAAEAYMNVLRDFAILDLNRNNVQLLNEDLRATRERFDVGEVTRTDVALSESRLAGSRSDVSVAEANLKASRAIYRQIIGSEPTKLVPGRPIDRLLPKTLNAALDVGHAEHPASLAALHAYDAAALQVRVVQGELAPTLSVQGNVSGQVDDAYSSGAGTGLGAGSANGTTNSVNASVLGVLTVPIYQGGQEYSRVREAKEILGQRRLEADIVRDQVRAAVVSAWGALEGAKAQIIAAQAQVEASGIALSGVREEYRVGQRTTLDVLNFQQELLNARVTLITAQRDRVVASYAVLQAIGRLNTERLGLKVAKYDAQVHYDQVRDKWFGLRTPDGR